MDPDDCMRIVALISAAALLGSAGHATAADTSAPTPTLPSFALAPQQTPSIWSGLRIGTDVFAVSGSGAVKGGFGAAVHVGYDREFDNNLVLGVQASTGFAPYRVIGTRLRGFDFATADVRVGYDMGRLMPYLIGGVALQKPNFDGGVGGFYSGASINNLFSGSAGLEAAGRIGAGVEYAVTDRLHVGVEVSVSRGPGFYPF
jgi:opacity protein-like surface antigen